MVRITSDCSDPDKNGLGLSRLQLGFNIIRKAGKKKIYSCYKPSASAMLTAYDSNGFSFLALGKIKAMVLFVKSKATFEKCLV
ncbi:MAG: hypothetical protein IPJ13_12910 [Saprospiraceae bacterium]|nr:hypothetical protein [Saprospiraceae bacterium]